MKKQLPRGAFSLQFPTLQLTGCSFQCAAGSLVEQLSWCSFAAHCTRFGRITVTTKFSNFYGSVAHLKWDKFIPLNLSESIAIFCPVMVWFCAFLLHDNQQTPRSPHHSFGSTPLSHPLPLLVLRLVSSDDHDLGVSVYCCCYAVLGGWAILALIMGVFGDETFCPFSFLKNP